MLLVYYFITYNIKYICYTYYLKYYFKNIIWKRGVAKNLGSDIKSVCFGVLREFYGNGQILMPLKIRKPKAFENIYDLLQTITEEGSIVSV